MTKRIVVFLELVILFCLTSVAHAGFNEPSFVYQTAISSITTLIVTVSTSPGGVGLGATQVDNPQLVGRVSVEIQNIDATANLWCLPVSTMPVVNGGRKITAGSSWVISILDKGGLPWGSPAFKFWCLSDGTSATKAVVSQLY